MPTNNSKYLLYLLSLKHSTTRIVQIKKRLQAVELICLPSFLHSLVRQSLGHSIALGKVQSQVRLQCSFYVQVQLRLQDDRLWDI